MARETTRAFRATQTGFARKLESGANRAGLLEEAEWLGGGIARRPAWPLFLASL